MAIINGQLHAGKQFHAFTARGFTQCLKLAGIKFIVIGDHTDAHFRPFKGTDVVANISVGFSGIAKFLICPGMQVKIHLDPAGSILKYGIHS